MQNKVKLITPFLMLFAGALASIIMYIRKFEFLTMLWVLLLVLVIFYIIGDVVRYIYAAVRPRIIPDMTLEDMEYMFLQDNVVAKEDTEEEEMSEDVQELNEEEAMQNMSDEDTEDGTMQMADTSEEEGYADENLN